MNSKHKSQENKYYTDHLSLLKPMSLESYLKAPGSKIKDIPSCRQYKTNYNITLNNPYAFIVLHLKKPTKSKNKLYINIPELCIFQSGKTYELLYSENGDVKGLNGIRLNDIYTTFKSRFKLRGQSKQDMIYACFETNINGKFQEEYLMLSDTDLLIICRKFKTDPFFRKLQYLKNKLQIQYEVESQYDAQKDDKFGGQAASCFLNLINDAQMLQKLGQERYLQYCNKKIAMFLNFQHNIRIYNCNFYYSKTKTNEYYLTNIKDLKFSNLTKSLQQRNQRLLNKQAQRNKILIISPQKYQKYKSHEQFKNVSIIQQTMNDQVFKIANQYKIKTNTERIKQQRKTSQAFKKLYSNYKGDLQQVLAQKDFIGLTKTLIQTKKRKSLYKPSKYMAKFMKLQKKVRSTFDTFESIYTMS